MKIAFLGNFHVSYSSESHYLKTFEKLGHEVLTFQEGSYIFNPIDLEKILKCDMFFWVHTHGWQTLGLEHVLQSCKTVNLPIVGYHLDLWLGIEREKDLNDDSYWKWLDYFFSVDKLMVDYLNERDNMPKAFFLPAGVFEDECYLGTPREEYKCDVLFVGSRGYHKEWPYREQLISWLETTYGDRFKQYGGGGLGTIRGKDLNDLYASAKVVVGDTLCKDFNYPYYLSDRIFETTGRGGFIIHPYIKGLGDLFKLLTAYTIDWEPVINEDTELATYQFNNLESLKIMIDYFIENNDQRETLRVKSHERTKRDHTYTQRLSKLIEIVQNEERDNRKRF